MSFEPNKIVEPRSARRTFENNLNSQGYFRKGGLEFEPDILKLSLNCIMIVTLFSYENGENQGIAEAFFQNEDLVIEGYDRGPGVEIWHGSDEIEYKLLVDKTELAKLRKVINKEVTSKHFLLLQFFPKWNLMKVLQRYFKKTPSILGFKKLLDKNGVIYKYSSN